MKTKLGFCLGWLVLLLVFTNAQALFAAGEPVAANRLPAGWLVDSDLDGVDDASDLCPNTPTGTSVNAYGCPLALVTCDYSTATVTLNSSGGNSGSTGITRYVLASNMGTILQISPTTTFSGLSGTATYMAVAITYDGAVTNLAVGNSLSAVSGSCYDWSDALTIKVCVATPPGPTPPTSCDYQIGQPIALQMAGGSSGSGIKTSYVLTDAAGKLVRLSSTPAFSSVGLVAGTYLAYALTYNDDNTIANLVVNGTNTLSQVTAACLAVSPGLSLVLCVGNCAPVCVPILVTRIR